MAGRKRARAGQLLPPCVFFRIHRHLKQYSFDLLTDGPFMIRKRCSSKMSEIERNRRSRGRELTVTAM